MWQMKTNGGLRMADKAEAKGRLCHSDEGEKEGGLCMAQGAKCGLCDADEANMDCV